MEGAVKKRELTGGGKTMRRKLIAVAVSSLLGTSTADAAVSLTFNLGPMGGTTATSTKVVVLTGPNCGLANGWESKRNNSIVNHGGRGTFCPASEGRVSNHSLR